jgi:hypothetical protein
VIAIFSGRRRIQALEARVEQLAARLVVTEVLYGAIAGLALRATSEPIRDTILRELRASVTVSVTGIAVPPINESLTLQTEEHAAQLLDQIEGFARREL